MNKIVLTSISLLLLASTACQAVIFARQVWQHPNGKTVELLSDAHALYFSGNHGEGFIDQKDLLVSINIDAITDKQQHDLITYAQLYGKHAHLFVEDLPSFLQEKHPDEKFELPGGFKEILVGLATLCKQHGIPHTNIECRHISNKLYKEIIKIMCYIRNNDSPLLNQIYKQLLMGCLIHDSAFMDARTIHALYNYTHNKSPKFTAPNHLIVVAGAGHIMRYVDALACMNYTCISSKTLMHPTLQAIKESHPDADSLEDIVKNKILYLLGLKHNALLVQNMDNGRWANAVLLSCPIDITKMIEERRSVMATMPVAAAETKEIAALRAAAPAVAIPVIRARL